MATHFGKNPVKGGRPPSDKRQAIRGKGVSRWAVLSEGLLEDEEGLFLFILSMSAILIKMYVNKYKMPIDREIAPEASIHAICDIEEYARRGRSWVWFSPPNLPIRAAAIRAKDKGPESETENKDQIIIIGPIFCKVERIKQLIQEIPCIDWGNQK